MLEPSKPVPNVKREMFAAVEDGSSLDLSMAQGCGQRGSIGFAGQEMYANGFCGSSKSVRSSQPEELVRFADMGHWSNASFANPAPAPLVPARPGLAAGVYGAASMVKLRAADTLIIGTAGSARPEQICGTPEKHLSEPNSDEVTLPNSRPRNSP